MENVAEALINDLGLAFCTLGIPSVSPQLDAHSIEKKSFWKDFQNGGAFSTYSYWNKML